MSEPEMTTRMQAELRLVDAALETEAISASDPFERELQELSLALRSAAPAPSDELARELGARVRAGFPRERRLRLPAARARLPKPPRPPAIVLAGAASLVIALAVVVGLQASDDEGARDGSPIAGEDRGSDAEPRRRESGELTPRSPALQGQSDSAPAPGAVAPEPPPGSPGFAPGERRRRIERSASLTLAAPAEQLDRVADAIARLTDRHDGFVLRSSLSTGDEGTTGGDFELRVPAERLQHALTDLSKLADVRSRAQSGADLTAEFASAAERLQAARAERRSLLRRLERAPSDSAAEAIRRRLDLNGGEIRGLRGQVRELRTRTTYAAVTISLRESDDARGGSSQGSDDDLGAAVDDALASLRASIEILVRVLGVAIPLGVAAAALGFAARLLHRRRREAALSR